LLRQISVQISENLEHNSLFIKWVLMEIGYFLLEQQQPVLFSHTQPEHHTPTTQQHSLDFPGLNFFLSWT
jgi:hypothetical protein